MKCKLKTDLLVTKYVMPSTQLMQRAMPGEKKQPKMQIKNSSLALSGHAAFTCTVVSLTVIATVVVVVVCGMAAVVVVVVVVVVAAKEAVGKVMLVVVATGAKR